MNVRLMYRLHNCAEAHPRLGGVRRCTSRRRNLSPMPSGFQNLSADPRGKLARFDIALAPQRSHPRLERPPVEAPFLPRFHGTNRCAPKHMTNTAAPICASCRASNSTPGSSVLKSFSRILQIVSLLVLSFDAPKSASTSLRPCPWFVSRISTVEPHFLSLPKVVYLQ